MIMEVANDKPTKPHVGDCTVIKEQPDEKNLKDVSLGTVENNNVEAPMTVTQELKEANNNESLDIQKKSKRERILSEGEASSGFETVSSADIHGQNDSDYIYLSSDDDVNIVVEISNEYALSKQNGTWKKYNNYGSDNSVRSGSRSKSDYFSGESANFRYDRYSKADSPRNHNQRRKTSERGGRWSREKDSYDCHKSPRSYDRDWHRKERYSVRSRRSRSSEGRFRSGSPGFQDYKRRRNEVEKDKGHFNKADSVKSKPKRTSYSVNENKFLTDSNKKRRNGDCDSSSSANKDFEKRKRIRYSSGSVSPVRRKYDTRDYSKKSDGRYSPKSNKSRRDVSSNKPRKRERTPFLVELEKKLKEAELLKNSTNVTLNQTDNSIVNKSSALEPTLIPSSGPKPPLPEIPRNAEAIYALERPPMPSLSVDNLPLVPGPTGLPVHITMTGEQIPYDMDGRRIPVGSNGHYLPLDPTGRLFPHIVSPANTAVPVHISEDGILRLPNLEPVPVGPPHKLPVNIDGSVILIGQDSRLLFPCPNLPVAPPPHLFNGSNRPGNNSNIPPEIYIDVPKSPLPSNSNQGQVKTVENQINCETPKEKLYLADLVPVDSCTKIDKNRLIKKYQKEAERRKDMLKYIEIEKNLGVIPSKGGIRRSIPMKLIQKKTLKDSSSSGSLDIRDSNSATVPKSMKESDTGGLASPISSSDEECDTERICGISADAGTVKTKLEDQIIKRIENAIKSLKEREFRPPAPNRFILSKPSLITIIERSSNESPLLRNRIKLDFLIPNATVRPTLEEKKNPSPFRSRSQNETGEREDKSSVFTREELKGGREIFTMDLATQCDFTTEIIDDLNSKIVKLEEEIVRLKNANGNLMDGFKNNQLNVEKTKEELKKALEEMETKDNEIQSLKRAMQVTRK